MFSTWVSARAIKWTRSARLEFRYPASTFLRALVEAGKARGLDVAWAPAEKLPHADSSFDGLICKVVLPYTDESVAIREWGRVLREGGQVRASYHGAGYFLRYALAGADWKERVYGVRSIVNGWLYAISGKRLPGFMGDTIYQSESRLRRHYASSKLELDASFLGRSYLVLPSVHLSLTSTVRVRRLTLLD